MVVDKKKTSQNAPMEVIEWIDNKVSNTIEEVSKFFSKDRGDLSVYPTVVYSLSKDNYTDLSKRQFTKDTVLQALQRFQYLIMVLNEYEVTAPSKELFCSFIGWSTSAYESILNSDGELKEAIEIVEDYLVDVSMTMAQNKRITASVAKFRNQVSGKHGHSLVTKKEEHEVQKADYRKSRDVLEAELEKLKLGNKKAE